MTRLRHLLDQGFTADLAWWTEFVGCWNGISFLHPPSSLPKTHLFTDASGSWGCAAWHGDAWFQVKWDARAELLSIAEKELIPIVLACQAWGSDWGRYRWSATLTIKQWLLTCDPGLVDTKGMMHLLRSLVLAEARLNCSLFPVYIDTRDNYLADSLSSDNAPFFLSKVQSADAHPTTVSPHVGPTPQPDADWSAPTWRQHFRAIFEQA